MDEDEDELTEMQLDDKAAEGDMCALSPRDLSTGGDAWFEYNAVSPTTFKPRLPPKTPMILMPFFDTASGSQCHLQRASPIFERAGCSLGINPQARAGVADVLQVRSAHTHTLSPFFHRRVLPPYPSPTNLWAS